MYMKKIIAMTIYDDKKEYAAEYDTLQEAYDDLDDQECCCCDDEELAESYYRLKCMIGAVIEGEDNLEDYKDEDGDYVFDDRS